jgi:glycosyltransferase involved in cell wall biosynthesis
VTVSLGVVANVFNEIHALPGWLESVSQWADDIQIMHAGPGGMDSTDGTIELLEKWRIPIHRGNMNDGFGIVRTAAVRASKCEWTMLLDADERFQPVAKVMTCSGESTPRDEVSEILQEYDCRDHTAMHSNFENLHKLGAKLTVGFGEVYDQHGWLRGIIDSHHNWDAVITIRRHWHDFTFKRPTQNWHTDPDFQVRLVRNRPDIYWDPNVRMHETLVGGGNRYQPNHTHGPFYEHHHFAFKAMNALNRAFNVACYDAMHWGHAMPVWSEFKKKWEDRQ